jgi:lipoyl(octanoyl) transferase
MAPVPSPPEPPRPDEPIARECVEGYLFSDPPTELLIFQRPPERGSIWVPISGKVDPTDASFDAALARELEEETGLRDPLRVDPLDWHVPFRADTGEVWRLHAYAVQIPRTFRPRLSPEHVAFEWVDLATAERRLDYPDNREAVAILRAFLAGRGAPAP